MPNMKYAAIDYGTKRIGIATSDDGGSMAFPLCVVENSKAAVVEIAALCRKEGVTAVVVGESHNLMMGHNPIMSEINAFAEALGRELMLPIFFMTEVFTSREAMHLQGDNAHNDASAAAIILQSYIDLKKHQAISKGPVS
jgi:putative Holliday junction resolvase